ncbi:MAG: hypothetical protein Q9201_007151 [Fulgogasparrea decipioides]
MKRKAAEDLAEEPSKKRAPVNGNGSTHFRDQLLQQAEEYHEKYITSKPYQHGVLQDLLEPQLLRKVRTEIQEHLSFTPKETDIYKIHQSGDLANLDGLDDSFLKLLPSLLTLRDALYSPAFRVFLSTVTGSGPLSGRKTDMAINVYTPGCHLLCHDDVIGSRRVSYILYLTDPDRSWKPEWGGALRLYPTVVRKEKDGKEVKVPSPDSSVSIPPAFNQLSFFAVQPGESFHDVEEVYASQANSDHDDGEARVRMAISGWYHIPQEGEDGYVEGLEESPAERSSLQQLQGSGEQHDKPLPVIRQYGSTNVPADKCATSEKPLVDPPRDESPLSEEDLDLLLKYIAPTYLTPDTLESVSDTFGDECSICLEKFLSQKFSASLKNDLIKQESTNLPSRTEDIENSTPWQVARPPHKHRFLYQQASDVQSAAHYIDSPLQEFINTLLPSEAFRKWLQLATGLTLSSHNHLVRRFRRGKDYTLATGYDKDESQLEIILAITPSPGWSGDEHSAADETPTASEQPASTATDPGKQLPEVDNSSSGEPGFGGYIAYMVGDDAEDESDDGKSADGVEVPFDMSTGARASKPSAQKRKPDKADPAVYKATTEDEDDGVLFSMPAGWNTLGMVLRDKGAMRFVKYVSQQAKGDRWDVLGEFGVVPNDEDGGTRDEIQGTSYLDFNIEHEESETEIECSDEG